MNIENSGYLAQHIGKGVAEERSSAQWKPLTGEQVTDGLTVGLDDDPNLGAMPPTAVDIDLARWTATEAERRGDGVLLPDSAQNATFAAEFTERLAAMHFPLDQE